MHNSNNPALRKDIFTGTLLAQAKLLGISTNINNCTTEELEEIVALPYFLGSLCEYLRGCPRRYYPGSNLCIMRLIIDIFTQASLLNVVRS